VLEALATPIARLDRGARRPGQARPRGPGLMALPWGRRADGHDLGRRDQIGAIGRFPSAPKLCAGAGLTRKVGNSDPTLGHGHITKQGSPGVGWILQEPPRRPRGAHCWPPPTASWPPPGTNIATVAIARWLLAGSCPILTRLEAAPAPDKTRPGALASLHEPATRPPGLTEQPGRTPPSANPTPGSEGVQGSPLRDLVRAFCPGSGAGPGRVKVLARPGRFT